MILMTRLTTIFLVLNLWTTTLKGQDFFEDGSMKRSEVCIDKEYGYESNHETSIKVGRVEIEQAYLKSLREPNDEQIQYRRVSSCCGFKSKTAALGKGFLDNYEVYYQGIK